jgi:hypothetical protein
VRPRPSPTYPFLAHLILLSFRGSSCSVLDDSGDFVLMIVAVVGILSEIAMI